MNNIFVYCEIENGCVASVSQELLSKAHALSVSLGCRVEAVAVGNCPANIEEQLAPYGADRIHLFEDPRLYPFTPQPHAALLVKLIREEQPQICLLGATATGRDLAPTVASALKCGLTADCTALETGDYETDGVLYKKLLYQIRPAFGGNIIATIVNPKSRPQMATVREGVMKKALVGRTCETVRHRVCDYVKDSDFTVKVIERRIQASPHNLHGASIVVAGGYGMGCRENFAQLFDLARLLHAEVGATRAAIDAGFTDGSRQIGQTGLTVRPKLYIACGISGQIQHLAGMRDSALVVSVNTDPEAPINRIADYIVTGDVMEVIPKMIRYYQKNAK